MSNIIQYSRLSIFKIKKIIDTALDGEKVIERSIYLCAVENQLSFYIEESINIDMRFNIGSCIDADFLIDIYDSVESSQNSYLKNLEDNSFQYDGLINNSFIINDVRFYLLNANSFSFINGKNYNLKLLYIRLNNYNVISENVS